MKLFLWPKSLASRTILILLAGFACIQLLGLLIHTVNQIKLLRIQEEQVFATRAVIIYRHIAMAPPAERPALIAKEALPKGDTLSISAIPPLPPHSYNLPLAERDILRASIFADNMPMRLHPRGLLLHGHGLPTRIIISFGLPGPQVSLLPYPQLSAPPFDQGPPDALMLPPLFARPQPDAWLTITSRLNPAKPWRSPSFASAFIVMTALGAAMIFWAVRKLLIPVRTLAEAAERLGQDVVNAPALPERGPSEIVTAAIAFNTMAARIRRFVEDRTFLLSAIGHDLRTPITRLKLRAEYMEDDEQRQKMLADLDEMEAMVAATLAFGRDITTTEPLTRLDLAILLRTILDEAADGNPDQADSLSYNGPDHLTIHARPLGLKRAFTNLTGNALKYGGCARITLRRLPQDFIQADIEDDGPGIAPEAMEAVFEPFRRLETSRNRETGGSGLGLSIARNIFHAHGGDVTLQNLPGGGLRARVTLPV
ncbi:ATP-binding protein [Acidocella sp.]|uniref:ATP-binding protein n=1 Tax=Acidocella sp. TaxID=50710 RepID=UPI002608B936|nr:ATP-binding protein [Acidocella sp.]MDD2794934.1 ATP-binding protein [Acidocella sp.]